MLVHLPADATPSALMTLREYGWIGVDIFFVLSGYLIGTQVFKEIGSTNTLDLKLFYVRRAFRIFPAFFVILAIYYLIPSLRDAPDIQPIWKFLTFTTNLDFSPGSAFSQSWTLAAEEQFYLVMPVLVLVSFRHSSARSILLLTITLVLVGAILRYMLWDMHVEHLVAAGKFRPAFYAYLHDVYYPTYTRIDGLLMGVLLAAARFYRPAVCRKLLSAHSATILGAALVLLALMAFTYRGSLAGTPTRLVLQGHLGATIGFPLISAGIALLLSAMLDLEQNVGGWAIPGTAVVANLSYSLYLTHKSVFHNSHFLFSGDMLKGSAGFLIYMLSSFLVAFLLWFCVERPFLRLRDRILQPGL